MSAKTRSDRILRFPRARPQPPRENHSARSSDACCSRRSLRILPTLERAPSQWRKHIEDSCGRKGIGETPQCVARGGSPAARGKRNVFP
ncbi:hypothetical protein CIT14_12080 [Virgibacillus profundi]|nr:hypothetical protein CIT14_12080 [Virgibacillus profundi]